MPSAPAPATSLLLAGGMCLLPFLVPYHQQPVLSFFPEWLAAALGVAAVLAQLANRSARPVALPAVARWLGVFALFLAVRAATAPLAYPQASVLAAAYVMYAVALIWLGAQLAATFGLERVATVLAAFFLLGALANSVAGTIQYYGRPPLLEDVIAELHGPGVYGNIAQRNLYANYLAVGEGALLFLWLRSRIRTAHAIAALVVLVCGGALSGSRGALLYPIGYVALGFAAVRLRDCEETRRLRIAACWVAAGTLAGHLILPWLSHAFHVGAPLEGAFERVSAHLGQSDRARITFVALRLFAAAPIAGVGTGEFAGAAYELGLDPALAPGGEIWTSPHNLPLHLLAETGLLGATLVMAGLGVWGWKAARAYAAKPRSALWWILAAVGIELIHSLVEFPLWSAHFLGITALLVGASSEAHPASMPRATRGGMAALCVVLATTLALLLRDYVRLDAARFTGTEATLAPAAQAVRDADTMRELTRGVLAPLAEVDITLGARLDRNDLPGKLAMSTRAARYWPANGVVVRQAVFLALEGESQGAAEALARALRTYPGQRDATIFTLGLARPADSAAVDALLAITKNGKPGN